MESSPVPSECTAPSQIVDNDSESPSAATVAGPENKKKRKAKEKPAESFLERREKRRAAFQASINNLSKSKVRDDGIHWRDAHKEFSSGEKAIIDEEVSTEVTWEEIDYDSIREAMAKEMLEQPNQKVIDPQLGEQYKDETSMQWDKFYSVNKQNFFKDRNYLGRFLQELNTSSPSPDVAVASSSIESNKAQQTDSHPDPLATDASAPPKRVLEAGSGVGNTLYPLMDMNPDKHFYAFDCSPTAIELLRSQPRYDTNRCRAFVCDITREEIPENEITNGSLDYVTMIFMLSAVPPEQMDFVLQRINRKMKIGGTVFFRDYGLYDMTQMRFYAKKTPNKLSENFFRRSDGTFTYFFSLEGLASLFERNGFSVAEKFWDTRVLSNRKRKIRMYRVWAQARFIKQIDIPLQ